jgi:hypothetical protein
MAFHNIPLFRELVRSLRINPGDEPPFSVELTRELEDLRKISLNLVCVFCVCRRHPELKLYSTAHGVPHVGHLSIATVHC